MDIEFERRTFSIDVDYDPESGAVMVERWRNQLGHFDRLGDLPAVTNYCPETGRVTYRRWHQGRVPQGPHRDDDKPARVTTNPVTGVDTCEEYMKLGDLHRDGDEPAEIFRYENGIPEEHAYWQFGKRHRNPQKGPAIIRYDENGKVRETEYWVNDRPVPPPSHTPSVDI